MHSQTLISRRHMLQRRALLLGLGGLAGGVAVGCGGGSDGNGGLPSSPNTPSETRVQLQTYPASSNATAKAILQNDSGGAISMFMNDSDNVTQSLYKNNNAAIRSFYEANGQIARVVDESTGQFLTTTLVNTNRTDFNLYNASGEWQSGWAVLFNSDGTYSTAQIVSSSGLQGQQVTGNLTGSVVASFSLLPSDTGGLGPVTALTTSSAVFALGPLSQSTTMLAVLDHLTDLMFSAAHAQTFTQSNLGSLIKNAFIGVAGALIYGSTIPAAPLIGAAIIGYAAYSLYQDLKNNQNSNLDTLDSATRSILGDSLSQFSASTGNPLTTISSDVSNYLRLGTSALSNLPLISSVRDTALTTANNVASTITSVANSTWQSVTSNPPLDNTTLQGLLVDNSGNSYQTTGTYRPADSSLTIDTGPSSGTRITATGTTGSNGTGTYTVSNNGTTTATGNFTSLTKALGTCQTQQSSGGQGAFTNVYDMGKDSGAFELTYQMYNIPDRLEVRSSNGTVAYSTGGLVSGGKTVRIPYSGGRMIYVIVTAPTLGTSWDYIIGCP